MKSGIYKIINLVNGKFYLGSSIDLDKRYHTHKILLESNKHYNKHLQSAFIEYGSISFEFHIIETIKNATKEKLLEREQHWINLTKCYDKSIGYNKRLQVSSNLGIKFENIKPRSKESYIKGGLTRRGRPVTQSQSKAVSEANKKRVGVKYNKGDNHLSICKCEICKKIRNKKQKLTRKSRSKYKFVMLPDYKNETIGE